MITIIIHEFGHLLVCKVLGGNTNGEIVLWPLGGFALCGPTGKGLWGDFAVALAGPLTHIPQSFIWYGMYYLMYIKNNDNNQMEDGWFKHQVYSSRTAIDDLHHHFLPMIFAKAAQLNMVLMCFNLLPIYPLDGGTIFTSSMLLIGIDQTTTGLLAAKIGMVVSLLGGILWGIVIFRSTFNLFIFSWIFYESWKMYKLAQNDRIDEHPLFNTTEFDNDNNGNGNASNDGAEMYTEYAERPWTQVSTSDEMGGGSNANGQKPWWNFWAGRQSRQTSSSNNGGLLSTSGYSNPAEEDYGF
jgi:Zn-dependent protease